MPYTWANLSVHLVLGSGQHLPETVVPTACHLSGDTGHVHALLTDFLLLPCSTMTPPCVSCSCSYLSLLTLLLLSQDFLITSIIFLSPVGLAHSFPYLCWGFLHAYFQPRTSFMDIRCLKLPVHVMSPPEGLKKHFKLSMPQDNVNSLNLLTHVSSWLSEGHHQLLGTSPFSPPHSVYEILIAGKLWPWGVTGTSSSILK